MGKVWTIEDGRDVEYTAMEYLDSQRQKALSIISALSTDIAIFHKHEVPGAREMADKLRELHKQLREITAAIPVAPPREEPDERDIPF